MASVRLHSDHRDPQFAFHRQRKPAAPTAPAHPTTSPNNIDLHTTAHFHSEDNEDTPTPRIQNRAQTFEQQLEHLTYLRGVITRARHDTIWEAGWGSQSSACKYRLFQLERILVRFDAAELELLRAERKGLQEKLASEEEKNEKLKHELNGARFERLTVKARTHSIVEGWDAASPASSVVGQPNKPAAPAAPPFLASLPTFSSTHTLDLLTTAIFPAENGKDNSDLYPRARTFDEQLEHLGYLRLVIANERDEAASPSTWEEPPPYRLIELEQTLARITSSELNLLRTETRRLQEKLAVSEKNNESLEHQLAGRGLEANDRGDEIGDTAGNPGPRYDACKKSPPESVRGERGVGGGEFYDDPQCSIGHENCHLCQGQVRASESDGRW